MNLLDRLTVLFVIIDDFMAVFGPAWRALQLQYNVPVRVREGSLSLSELMAIELGFQAGGTRSFKHYYEFLRTYHKAEFPQLVSYTRYLELRKQTVLPLVAFFQFVRAECDGESLIDSTKIEVSKLKRMFSHKVFKGLAALGKSSMGWFFGFKLHLVTTTTGHPISFKLTPGNVDDRSGLVDLSKDLWGKIFGDKGYISKEIFAKLFDQGLQVVTALKDKMKYQIMTKGDSDKLSGRIVIERELNIMKNVGHLEHSRHRSITGFIINILSSLCALCLRHL